MSIEKQPCVYIMTSQRNGTLYVGVTSHLVQRVLQHKQGAVAGFTDDYDVKMLVWFEQHVTMEAAISREKTLKRWRRAWKLGLIEQDNPDWDDLYDRITA